MLCFLETPVLRSALLPYYRRYVLPILCNLLGHNFFIVSTRGSELIPAVLLPPSFFHKLQRPLDLWVYAFVSCQQNKLWLVPALKIHISFSDLIANLIVSEAFSSSQKL